MRIISTDPDEPGVFAFGQVAYGIFALGQIATGVIAIGQVARGVVAIGQGAIGVVAIGQGAFGVLYGGGMIAVGGRGFGLALKMLPKIAIERFARPALPPLSTFAELSTRSRGPAWVLARIVDGGLSVDGAPLAIEPTAKLTEQLRDAIEAGHTHACVTVDVEERDLPTQGGYREAAPRERVLVGARMQSWREGPPRVRFEGAATGVIGLALRAIGMAGLAWGWWMLAGQDVLALLK